LSNHENDCNLNRSGEGRSQIVTRLHAVTSVFQLQTHWAEMRMFKAWVCSRLLAGIADSNPARSMDVCLLKMCVCVVRWRSLRRADHSSRRVLSSECVSVCGLEISTMRRPRHRWVCLHHRRKNMRLSFVRAS